MKKIILIDSPEEFKLLLSKNLNKKEFHILLTSNSFTFRFLKK